MLNQKSSELLRPCWQWCANRCNNSQRCWLITRVGLPREVIALLSLRAVQTDATLLSYARLCDHADKRNVGTFCLKSLTGFKLCATTHNNKQQHATGCANRRIMSLYIQQCWELLANNVASFSMGLYAILLSSTHMASLTSMLVA